MSSPRPGPLQMSRDERRLMLSRHFVGVIEVLAEGGESYPDVSVARLISEGGISRSAFYDYFDDKGDLLAAVTDVVVDEMSAAGDAWWTLASDGGKHDLLEALRPAIDVFRQHLTILRSVVEGAFSDPRVRVPYHRLVEGANESLAGHIRAGQANGTIVAGLDPVRTARWLNLMNERGLHYMLGERPDDDFDAALTALTEIIWRTLYEGARPAEGARRG